MSNPTAPGEHPHLDSIQLRLIAEAASGTRGTAVHFVTGPDGNIREVSHDRRGDGARTDGGIAPPPLEAVVIPAYTEDKVPLKPPLNVATIHAEGVDEPVDLLDLPGGLGAADAVFWSESAVEKFLLPYYASVYGNQAAKAVSDILLAFHGDRGLGGPSARAGADDELTYAMAHIPKSEYVMLSDGGSVDVGADLAVLYKDGSGKVRAERLRDFVRRRAQQEG
jgi:hypothetical protein